MNDATLIIMAAGIGSRFGGGVKQLEQVGPDGELIMDYSICDALKAGFNRVVFIIRRDLEQDFREMIGDRISRMVPVEYVYQSLDFLPRGFKVPLGRKKPWGTAQAVLCCRGVVREPFAVINADDYYGRQAFEKIYAYLLTPHTCPVPYDMCMAGFILKNTLSENGGVTRGVCTVDAEGFLRAVAETPDVRMNERGEILHGAGDARRLSPDDYVSMNMWGAYPEFIDCLEERFIRFLEGLTGEEKERREFLLPVVVDQLLREKRARVKVLETRDRWFGVTYRQDRELVAEALRGLIAEGMYGDGMTGVRRG